MAFFIPLLIALVLTAISYVLTPKPKSAKQKIVANDLQEPTAEAGRPIPVVFGEKIVKDVNVLWFGEKYVRVHKE